MGKLFISHSSKDKVVADALVNRAKALGYDYFLDFQGIRGGAAWEKGIYDAMRRAWRCWSAPHQSRWSHTGYSPRCCWRVIPAFH